MLILNKNNGGNEITKVTMLWMRATSHNNFCLKLNNITIAEIELAEDHVDSCNDTHILQDQETGNP